MIPESLRRGVRVVSKLGGGLVAAFCLSSSVGYAQTTIQITDWSGNVYPAHAHLYTVHKNCSNPGGMPNATVCEWYVRKLYGNNAAVVVVIHAPNGANPACSSGATQYLASGYTRSSCGAFVSSTVYGVN
jgi:hypothetical protein